LPIYKNEDKREHQGGEDIVGANIHARGSGGSVEGECAGGKETRVLMVEKVKELFTKIQKEFGEFNKELRKVDELRLLEQGMDM